VRVLSPLVRFFRSDCSGWTPDARPPPVLRTPPPVAKTSRWWDLVKSALLRVSHPSWVERLYRLGKYSQRNWEFGGITAMKVHAIQTGFVRIKSAQVEGRDTDYHDGSPSSPIETGRSGCRRTHGSSTIGRVQSWSIPAKACICSKLAGRFILMSDGKLRFESIVKRRSVRNCGH
jgi:hypothetical protein